MDKLLFNNSIQSGGGDWIVEEFFNSIYSQGRFLWALPLLIDKNGCVLNEDYCLFPDFTDIDPSCHFDGVMFGVGNDEIIVNEETYVMMIAKACRKYIDLHPSEKLKVNQILSVNNLVGPF